MIEDDRNAIDEGMTDDEADEVLREAIRRQSDLSADPAHPNYDAGLATDRDNFIDKFGADPEDEVEEDDR